MEIDPSLPADAVSEMRSPDRLHSNLVLGEAHSLAPEEFYVDASDEESFHSAAELVELTIDPTIEINHEIEEMENANDEMAITTTIQEFDQDNK